MSVTAPAAAGKPNSTVLVAGILSPLLALLTPAIPIALLLSIGASVTAFVTGIRELQRVQAGEISQEESTPVLLGLAGGGLGCLMQLVMGAVSVGLVLFALMIVAANA